MSGTLDRPDVPSADLSNQKRVLEILRISAVFLTQNQISIRNNLFPFIILVALGYALTPGALVHAEELGMDNLSKAVDGVPATPVAISIALLVIFMRIGFLLFHGLDLASSNKSLIIHSKFPPHEEIVLLQSFKDAYLIDTFLALLNTPPSIEQRRIRSKRIAALFVNIVLNLSLLFSQYISLILIFSKSKSFAFAFFLIYFFLYIVFASKVVDLRKTYPLIAETENPPVYSIYAVYFSAPLFSALVYLSVIGIIRFSWPF